MPRQWIIFGLVGLSMVISLFLARDRAGAPTPRAECLADRDCQKGERCVVVPKGDGFVTLGQCGESCEDDAACANGWACGEWAEQEGRLVPARGLGPQVPRVKACAHRSRLP
jgi:hypothetical protein